MREVAQCVTLGSHLDRLTPQDKSNIFIAQAIKPVMKQLTLGAGVKPEIARK